MDEWRASSRPRRSAGSLDGRLGGRQAGDGNTVWGARDIVEPHLMAKLNAGRLATMLSADAYLEVRPGRATPPDPNLYHLSDPFDINGRKGVGLEDALLHVEGEELPDVVPAVAEHHLGHVIGAEREKIGVLGDFVGDK